MRRLKLALSLVVLAVPASAAPKAAPEDRRTLRPGYLGVSFPVTEPEAKALDAAGRADVSALCPEGGTHPSRRQLIVPFRGVRVGPVAREGGAGVVELDFPYGYDALYAALIARACRDFRVTASSAAASGDPGAVPGVTGGFVEPEKLGPPPLAPREGRKAQTFSVHASQTRFLTPGDDADLYFACPQSPSYLRGPVKDEWQSFKPANLVRVLDIGRKPGQSTVTLELSDGVNLIVRRVAADCPLTLARRARGDRTSASMTTVSLTQYGYPPRKWAHWRP